VGRAAFGQASLRLQQAAGTAVTALLNIQVDPATPASVVARAADLTLSYQEKAIAEDIEAELSEMGYAAEVAQAALHGDKRGFDALFSSFRLLIRAVMRARLQRT